MLLSILSTQPCTSEKLIHDINSFLSCPQICRIPKIHVIVATDSMMRSKRRNWNWRLRWREKASNIPTAPFISLSSSSSSFSFFNQENSNYRSSAWKNAIFQTIFFCHNVILRSPPQKRRTIAMQKESWIERLSKTNFHGISLLNVRCRTTDRRYTFTMTNHPTDFSFWDVAITDLFLASFSKRVGNPWWGMEIDGKVTIR